MTTERSGSAYKRVSSATLQPYRPSAKNVSTGSVERRIGTGSMSAQGMGMQRAPRQGKCPAGKVHITNDAEHRHGPVKMYVP